MKNERHKRETHGGPGTRILHHIWNKIDLLCLSVLKEKCTSLGLNTLACTSLGLYGRLSAFFIKRATKLSQIKVKNFPKIRKETAYNKNNDLNTDLGNGHVLTVDLADHRVGPKVESC